MKKLLFLFMLPALGFVSCSGDDEVDSIVGRWNLFSITDYNNQKENLNSCDLQTFLNFNIDGKGKFNLFYTDYPDNPEIEPCGIDVIWDFTYSYEKNQNNNNLILEVDGEFGKEFYYYELAISANGKKMSISDAECPNDSIMFCEIILDKN